MDRWKESFTHSRIAVPLVVAAMLLGSSTATADPLIEVGGMVHFDATDFDALDTQSDGGTFVIVPDEAAGDPDYLATASDRCDPNGQVRYMQILNGTGGDSRPPFVPGTNAMLIYEVRIDTPGTYRIWFRGAAASGSDDSAYIRIRELDPDEWWRVNPAGDDDGTFRWQGDGGHGTGTGGGVGDGGNVEGPTEYVIDTPGIYTLEVQQREDGFGIDEIIMDSTGTFDGTDAGADGIPCSDRSITISVRVAAGNDDAEEHIREGNNIDLGSSDLELGSEGGGADEQHVGMRFVNVEIPPTADIQSAFIQFTVDESDDEPTSLRIVGELVGNAGQFTSANGNISSRPRTSAVVEWNNIPAWTNAGDAGPDQATPDISAIIQEIVDQLDWADGNALVIIIEPTGPNSERTAESFNGSAGSAPLLTVSYTVERQLESIDLQVVNHTLEVGDTTTSSVRGFFDIGGSVDLTDPSTGTTYTSTDPAVLSVDANGVVTAVGLGTADIIAMNGDLVDMETIFVGQGLTHIAFIVGDPDNLGSGDQAVKDRLESLLFDAANQLDPAGSPAVVDVFDDNTISENNINDNYDLVISSATISSGNVGGRFRCLNIPHIYWEQALNNGTGREDLATAGGTDTVAELQDPAGPAGSCGQGMFVVDPAALSHPVLQGLATTNCVELPDTPWIRLFNSDQNMSFADVTTIGGDVVSLGENFFVDHAVLMAVDTGGRRADGSLALGRRVFLPFDNNGFEDATAQALAIFDNAVNWSLAGARIDAPQDALFLLGESRLLPTNTDQLSVLIGSAGGFCQTDITGDPAITYVSSNPGVATVTADGLVSALDGGVTTITARFGGFEATLQVEVVSDRLAIVRSFAFGSEANFNDVGQICPSFNDPSVPMTYLQQGGDNADTIRNLEYNPLRGFGYIITNPEHFSSSDPTKVFGPFDDSANNRNDYNTNDCWEGLYDSFIGLKDFDNDDEQGACTFVPGAAVGPCEDLCFRSTGLPGGGHPNPGPDGISGTADDDLTCRGQAVLRLDVPRGLYRIVAAMGDADNVHAHGMVIEDSGMDDGEVGDLNNPHRWLIRDFDQSAYTIGETEPTELALQRKVICKALKIHRLRVSLPDSAVERITASKARAYSRSRVTDRVDLAQ